MQIEYTFLRSRVARRVFWLFLLCALLPVGALSLVSLFDVTDQLTQQAKHRVQQESKAMGMAIVQRLILLDIALESISRQHHGISQAVLSDVPMLPSTPEFSGMAHITEDGATSVFLGELRLIPTVSSEQWALLRQKKPLLTTEMDETGARRLFLMKISDSETWAAVAEIKAAYLWDIDKSMTLPDGMSMCVFGPAQEVLFCSPSAPATLRDQRVGQSEGSRPSQLEWRDAQDSYIAGYWSIPLKSSFSTASWTVLMSTSQSLVLEPLRDFYKRFGYVVVIAVSFVALLSVRQIRKFMVPLEQLGEGTRRVAARNFSQPVQVRSGDEFEELAVSFNSMAGRLSHQFTQLATIHEIDRSVLSVLDPSRIVDTVLVRLREVSPCEGVAVLLMDQAEPTQGWLYARSGVNHNQTAMTGVSVSEAERAMLISHKGGSTLIGAEGAGAFAELCSPGVVSLLVLPLFRSRDLLGGIALSYRRTPEMDAEERERLRQLADQVAVALSNASDLAERKRAETSLRESHARLEQDGCSQAPRHHAQDALRHSRRPQRDYSSDGPSAGKGARIVGRVLAAVAGQLRSACGPQGGSEAGRTQTCHAQGQGRLSACLRGLGNFD